MSTAHRFWRIFVLKPDYLISGAGVYIAELELRSSIGGADQCTGGTPMASSAGYPAANAFDDNPATHWISSEEYGVGEWIGYEFATAVSVAQIAIRAPAAPNNAYAPREFKLQWSDDGAAWHDQPGAAWSGAVSWAGGELRTYLVDGPYTITGILRNSDGDPVPGVVYALRLADGAVMGESRADAVTGAYTLRCHDIGPLLVVGAGQDGAVAAASGVVLPI